MKILLDEHLQRRLKAFLKSDFQVFLVRDMGWSGLRNGALRERLNENGFTFLITADKNLPFQQNLNKADFTVILLGSRFTAWRFHVLLLPKIQAMLQNPPSPLPKLIYVDHDDWHDEDLIQKLKRQFPPDQILFI